jgi:arylsulfatase A-like enzyme
MKTVLLTVDALRADHLSQYGYERETMPAVDRLVSSGTRFDSAFANGTNTGVSLPSLLTSQYFGVDAIEQGPNVATAIGTEATTAGFHSNTLFSSRIDSVTGFDCYEDYGSVDSVDKSKGGTQRAYDRLVNTLRPVVEQLGIRERAEKVQEFVFPVSFVHEFSVYTDAATLTDHVLGWVSKHADEDFFLWVHYMDPHRPYGIDVDDPAFGEPATDEEIRDLMSKAGVSPEDITPSERERLIDLYDSDIRYTSEHVSRLLDGFENLDIWEETGIVFTADHGEEFGDHGYYYHRNRPYDELLHVPLVVKFPTGCKEQNEVDSQRELLDVAPTLCAWHDVEPPSEFLGKPLFEEGQRQVVATGSFIEQDHVVAGRWDGWKYISVQDTDTELFDLTADLFEKRDIAGDHPNTIAEFEQGIPDSVFMGESVSVEAEDNEVRQRLADLGYME